MKTLTIILLTIIVNTGFSQNSNWIEYTASNKIYDLAADGNKLWVSTIGGCATVDQSTGAVEQKNISNTELPVLFIESMDVQKNGDKWFQDFGLGITKFNGTNWTSYTILNSEIPGYNMRNMRDDQSGNTWMMYIDENHIVKFDGANWITYDSIFSSLPPFYITKFEIDDSGVLWILTTNSGLIKFDGTTTTIYNTSNSQIPSNKISDIVIDDLGRIWLACNGFGLTLFTETACLTFNTSNSSIPSNNIPDIETQNNAIWGIYNSGDDGLFKFDNGNWTDFNSTNSSLPQGNLTYLQLTSNGDKWMLTGDWPNWQLIQFDDNNVTYHNITNSPLSGNNIIDIDVDTHGKLWIADIGDGSNGGQLVSYQNHVWEHYPQETEVDWVTIQNDSIIWMGMAYRLGKFMNGYTTIYNTMNSALPSNYVYNAAIDTNGNAWFATNKGLCEFDGTNWTVYDTSNSDIPQDWVEDVIIDSLNNIWIFTQLDDGLTKFDGTNWTNYNTTNSGIGSNSLNVLKIDRTDALWIGTPNNGLTKFDGTNWTIYNSTNAVLPTNDIRSIGFDNQNNLWVGTNQGASYYDGSNWTIFTTDNSGLPTNDVRDFEFDNYGNVWIGTGQGGIGVYNYNGVDLEIKENTLDVDDILCKIYPVPFSTDFNVELDKRYLGSTLFLYDTFGRLVNQTELKDIKTNVQIQNNNSGIYYFKIMSNSKMLKTGKIIKL